MSNTPLDQVLKAKADYETKRQAAINDLLAKRTDIDKQLEALGYDSAAAPKKRRGRRGPMSEATRSRGEVQEVIFTDPGGVRIVEVSGFLVIVTRGVFASWNIDSPRLPLSADPHLPLPLPGLRLISAN